MLARLKRFSFISIPNDRQFVKRVSEKILMDFAILRGIRSLRAEKNASAAHRAESAEAHSFQAPADIKRLPRCSFHLQVVVRYRVENKRNEALHRNFAAGIQYAVFVVCADDEDGERVEPRLAAEIFAQKNVSFSTMIARENPLVNGEKNPPESCVIRGGDNAYRSPLRPRLRLTRWTGCPAFFFALDAFVRATGLLAGALSTRTGVPPRRILPSLPMTTG